MKILIISGFFYPVKTPRSFRTTELAKELTRLGHDVTVCIPPYDFDYTDFLEKYPMQIDHINVRSNLSTPKINNKISDLYYRIRNRIYATYLCYPTIKYFWKIPKYLNDKNKFDCLISIAVPHPIHWGVARALKNSKRKITSKWIADCGDPFMLCATDSFKKPFYFKWFEKLFCKTADYITVPVESGKNGYYPEFRYKIKVIPQGFNFEETKIVEKYEPNKVVTFAYAGSFIPGLRDPRPILDFLSTCKKDFRFYIYTNQFDLIEPYKEKLRDKIIISGFIDRDELVYRMSTYDFLLNIENGTKVQSPSKLIDYSISKRPVLSINSQNIDKEKFEQFLECNYDEKLEMPNIDDYNIMNVTKKFLDLVR